MLRRPILTALLTASALASAIAEPVRLSDISAKSPWAMHLDAAKLQNSPLGAFLVKTAGFERVMQLQGALKEELSLDLSAIESVTLSGSGERWQETAVVLRGVFDGLDLSAFPAAKGEATHRGFLIHEGPKWNDTSLYLSRRSTTELVAGTSLQAIRESLDLLDGGSAQKSWEGIELADHARKELAAATAQLALDMVRIGAELQFEADFTRSMRRAWLLIGTRDQEVEVTVLIDSTDAQGLSYLRSQLGMLIAMLTAGKDGSPELLELFKALRIETQDHWMTAKISAPPEKAARYLQSLAPLFKEEPKPEPANGPTNRSE